MPYRLLPFVNNEIYHVFNRSIAGQKIFTTSYDCDRYLQLISFYRFSKLPLRFSYYKRLSKDLKEDFTKKYLVDNTRSISILAYCIMPNHFHFLIKQITENALSNFMRNIQNGYSKYFNLKYKRTGSLFQCMFKAARIETDEQLLHVSRYIHLNPTTAYLVKREKLEEYFWSSLPIYIQDSHAISFVDYEQILHFFSNRNAYKKFVFDQIDYQRELSKIKHLTFGHP